MGKRPAGSAWTLAAALLIVGGIAVAWHFSRSGGGEAEADGGATSRFATGAPQHGVRRGEAQSERGGTEDSPADSPEAASGALRQAIADARARREAASGRGAAPYAPSAPAGGSGTGPEEPSAAPVMDSAYIRQAVEDLKPLLGECYELALAAAEREERGVPEGRLLARFVFAGEPEVGGIVEESTILEESTLRDPVLEECLGETLYTLELPAPEGGGRITVHYPFELHPDADRE